MRTASFVLLFFLVAGCVTTMQRTLNERFGQPDPTRHDHPTESDGSPSYRSEVRPILERRCVVCHGCYDAPCQLKLGAWDGIARGASKQKVYDSSRLAAAAPTRLFVDANLPSEWRGMGFFPVLNERVPKPEANLASSALYRSLQLKRAHPLPQDTVLPDSFDFSLNRKQTCPTVEEYDQYEKRFPLGGMPYGLPGIGAKENDTLTRWLQAGSPYDGPPEPSFEAVSAITAWESFLNGASRKEQLMSRYLYEHLFLGHLYFDTDPQRRAYRLVRSTTPPGQPIDPIAGRRPYDPPRVVPPYYRLRPEGEAILAKTHMPYTLSANRMAKYRKWFLDPPYSVDALPSYDVRTASNPFVTFRAIPTDSRYEFLLDEAAFFVMNFIKGPVCRGQLALDVIEDQFWVFFVEPSTSLDEDVAEELAQEARDMQMPAERGSTSSLIAASREYSRLEARHLAAKSKWLTETVEKFGGLRTSLIWDGDGTNANAALTVFRHFDSATVERGLIGPMPKTAWVVSYPLLERIYYLLVAGYDVFGNVGHQLNSRLYMDFLRMEGESNFLVLLPETARVPTRDFWYRETSDEVRNYVYGDRFKVEQESGIRYRTSDPRRELLGMLNDRLRPVLDTRFELSNLSDTRLRSGLQDLGGLRGASLQWLPETIFLSISDAPADTRYFTILRNVGHANVSNVFREKKFLLPDEDTLTVVPGFIGAYPNAFYSVTRAELPALTRTVGSLASEQDYGALADRYAIRRSDARFWAASDSAIEAYAAWAPREAGLFDYNRLENR